MRINNNIMALNAHRQLSINNTNTQKALEKLSSGYRINRAGDDAAGLSISEKMRAQIRGLNMASKNAQDGISLIQTAEGALNEVHEILQRMRELAVQAANDTNQDVDRQAIQDEVDQLAVEITRIANNTEFNNKKLLNGDLETVGLTFHIGANKDQNMSLTINDMSSKTLEVQGTVYSKEVISDSKLY
ncbi:MAG: flagellin, partial [Clostridiales bacterium]|nr:flagellin [Clostridiales bacterium]